METLTTSVLFIYPKLTHFFLPIQESRKLLCLSIAPDLFNWRTWQRDEFCVWLGCSINRTFHWNPQAMDGPTIHSTTITTTAQWINCVCILSHTGCNRLCGDRWSAEISRFHQKGAAADDRHNNNNNKKTLNRHTNRIFVEKGLAHFLDPTTSQRSIVIGR